MRVLGLDHVQLAMPPTDDGSGEEAARGFFGGLLGLTEVPKPEPLRESGGLWFTSAVGGLALHLGIEEDFRPARKAHPALLVDDLAELGERLRAAGLPVREDTRLAAPRVFTEDPFGNRIELIRAQP